ncbi:glycosyltransferase family 4 protein [Patescibacteria group bacterium]|nr:glycosyltransferase family 4 protein [Patescibacteria group bacterium]MBU1500330.1 glycosyltransferase family 4 protein [Patescibacteria group bacterium]
MKKIVLDARFYGPSHTGLGRYTQALITGLYQLKPRHRIILLSSIKAKKRLQTLFPKFEVFPIKARHYSFAEQLELPQVLKFLKPDLVHFLHFNAPIFYSQPFLVTIHDLIKHHSKGLATTTHWPFIYPFKRMGYYLTINHAINHSKLILTPSQAVKKDILQFYPVRQNKIVVTPEAADQIFFKPITEKIKELIPDKPYLIFTGNAYPHKNLIQLIKAVQLYRQKYNSQLQLVIVTAKDAFYQRLSLQVRRLNALSCIKIKGYSSDVQIQNLYHYSVAFITPSLFEGFGLPGLEAMASQTLVLSSNRTSLPEVYGRQAMYFDPDNLDAIIKVIHQAVNLTNRKQRLQSAQKYARSFSWQKTAQLTLNAYENCLCLRSDQ